MADVKISQLSAAAAALAAMELEVNNAGTSEKVTLTQIKTLFAVIGQGVHEVYIDAASLTPAATNGCADAAKTATGSNAVNYKSCDFDASTQEFAHFKIRMPKSWNLGTVTFIPEWTAASGSGGVVWALQAVAVSNDDTIDAAFGTEQTSTDTLLTAGDEHAGPESSAITIAGTPAAGDMVYFRIKRNVSDGSDTLAVDAKLLGLTIRMTLNAANDA